MEKVKLDRSAENSVDETGEDTGDAEEDDTGDGSGLCAGGENVTGPPDFLKDTVGPGAGNQAHSNPRKLPYGSKLFSASRTRKELPAGAIVGAKPQAGVLVDLGNQAAKEEARKPPEDAAKLLGVCLQCSVPKTYSAAKEGLICPLCKDRPMNNDGDLSKRRGSKIKDKERSKRMKGQSSHASWKSETEMHLRQQFD
ncbi:hypothetical protein L7F22_025234 [Adiantum nelumboides]|nr:hypothetical protein [Adiantum nelumboides]